MTSASATSTEMATECDLNDSGIDDAARSSLATCKRLVATYESERLHVPTMTAPEMVQLGWRARRSAAFCSEFRTSPTADGG
jgi:hypothetical protein